jgi:hypothetical protein
VIIYNLEIFLGWCGNCQRFSTRWIQIANNTKLWHEKVIRVGAIDCALPENDPICYENNVVFYPKFAFFQPFATSRTGISIPYDLTRFANEQIIGLMVDFIEKLYQKPKDFPVLQPFG